MSRSTKLLSAFLLAGTFLAGCSQATPLPPSPTSIPPSATAVPPTVTPLPTDTLTPTFPPPTNTPTAPPTGTNTPVPTDTPTPTQTEIPGTLPPYIPLPGSSKETVNIYFVLVGTGEATCGSRILAISSGVKVDGDIEKDVTAGLRSLFSHTKQYYGDLYNPLYASRLRVQKVDYERDTDEIVVVLSGTYKPTGDPCDNERVRAQVWSTIRQFRGVKGVTVYLNNGLLGDRLSNDN